ncbi:MAG: hypothetical protein JW806_06545 [Sedimentisphaerales bacterium]|nr:hypothetical protein [Sedimentisphaerales bacterium]
MRRIAFVCFLMLHSIVYATQYSDPCLGISFTLPDSWECTAISDLPKDISAKLVKAFNNVVTICHEAENKPYWSPGILVEYRKFEEATCDEAESFASSFAYKPHIDTGYLADWRMWQMRTTSKEFTETASKDYYDLDKHFAYAMKEYVHNDGRKLCVVVVKLLGSNGITELNCYSRDKDSTNFLKMIDDVIASFGYSEGHKFKKSKLTSRELSRKMSEKSIGLISKVLTWLLIGSTVLWILGKIFRR